MKKESVILPFLRRQGHRITTARTAIAKFAEDATKPFSANEMHALLSKKGLETNKVTVYRELAFLEKEGLLHGVKFQDGVQRYEVATEAHRHHLICTGCKSVQNIEMDHDLDGIEKKISRKKSFTVQSHALEFYGLCERCS